MLDDERQQPEEIEESEQSGESEEAVVEATATMEASEDNGDSDESASEEGAEGEEQQDAPRALERGRIMHAELQAIAIIEVLLEVEPWLQGRIDGRKSKGRLGDPVFLFQLATHGGGAAKTAVRLVAGFRMTPIISRRNRRVRHFLSGSLARRTRLHGE